MLQNHILFDYLAYDTTVYVAQLENGECCKFINFVNKQRIQTDDGEWCSLNVVFSLHCFTSTCQKYLHWIEWRVDKFALEDRFPKRDLSYLPTTGYKYIHIDDRWLNKVRSMQWWREVRVKKPCDGSLIKYWWVDCLSKAIKIRLEFFYSFSCNVE